MKSEQFGRYQIIKEIGAGGMATVYSAYDPQFDRKVAIKVLPKELTKDPQFIERFNREAQTIARLEHPSIVPVYDYGEQDGQPYLVMRHMTGGTLREYLKRHGPLSIQQAAELLSRLAPALDKAHAVGIIHRDIKPANILFDEDQNPYLSDFGIVKLAYSDTTLTGTADTIGTPAYMSPEQARTQKDLDGRSDVYSLAVILFEMLTGEQPYKADTPVGMVVAHIQDPIPHIVEKRGDLPATTQRVIDKGLAKERDDRFATSRELVDALRLLATKIEEGGLETIDGIITELVEEKRYQPEPRIMPEPRPVPEPIPVPTAKPRSTFPWVWVAGGFVLFIGVVIVCVAVYWYASLSPAQEQITSEQIQTQIVATASAFAGQAIAPVATTTPVIQLVPTNTPLPPATQTPVPVPTDTPVLPRIYGFMACPGTCNGANATRSYAEAIKVIDVQWDYENIPYGAKYERIWSMQGREWARYTCIWTGASSGTETQVTLSEPDGLHSGIWQVRILIDDVELMREEFTVVGNWTFWEPGGSFDSCYGKR